MTTSRINKPVLALRTAYVAGPVAALIALLLTTTSPLALVGRPSIGLNMVALGTLTALLAFAFHYWLSQRGGDSRRHTIINTLTLTLALTAVTSAVSVLLVITLNSAFTGLELDKYTSALLVGIYCGVVAHAITNTAYVINTERVTNLTSAVLIGGVLLSMVTTSDQDWWQANLSTLGMTDSSSKAIFNVTLIFSAFMLIVLSNYLLKDLNRITGDGTLATVPKSAIIRWLMVFIGLALGGVGLFPYEEGSINAVLHNTSAGLTALGFVVLIGALPWLIKGLSREFYATSYGMIGALLMCYYLFMRVGYFNLTTFELAAFSICFLWLTLFLQNIDDLSRRHQT